VGGDHGRGHQEEGCGPERHQGEGWGTRGIASLEEVPPVGAAGSQAWANGQTKTNIAPKIVDTLFFLVVGNMIKYCLSTNPTQHSIGPVVRLAARAT